MKLLNLIALVLLLGGCASPPDDGPIDDCGCVGDFDSPSSQAIALHIEISDDIRCGERFMATQEFEAALKEFNEALLKIRAMPFAYEPISQLRPDLDRCIDLAQQSLADEKAREVERQRRVFADDRLELAFMLFEQEEFAACTRMCDQILAVDPTNAFAPTLKEDAGRMRRSTQGIELVRMKIQGWRQAQGIDGTAGAPEDGCLRFPSREEWAEISRRALEGNQP